MWRFALVVLLANLSGCTLPEIGDILPKGPDDFDGLDAQIIQPGYQPLYEDIPHYLSGLVTNQGFAPYSGPICMLVNGVAQHCEAVALAPGQSTRGWEFMLEEANLPIVISFLDQRLELEALTPRLEMGEWGEGRWVDIRLAGWNQSDDASEFTFELRFHNGTQDVEVALFALHVNEYIGPREVKAGAERTVTLREDSGNFDPNLISGGVAPRDCEYNPDGSSACIHPRNGDSFRWKLQQPG